MLNTITIQGRLTSDPVLRRTQSDVPVVTFRIACEEDYQPKGGERRTDFFNVTAWRNLAEFVSSYFCKGKMIIVNGRLQNNDYTDKDGNRVESDNIVAQNVYFSDSKKNERQSEDQMATGRQAVSIDYDETDDFAELDEDDGDLPF